MNSQEKLQELFKGSASNDYNYLLEFANDPNSVYPDISLDKSIPQNVEVLGQSAGQLFLLRYPDTNSFYLVDLGEYNTELETFCPELIEDDEFIDDLQSEEGTFFSEGFLVDEDIQDKIFESFE